MATTQVQGAADSRAVNLAYGLNYVFFDYGDPLTTFCNGKNSSDPVVQERVKAFMKERGITQTGELVSAKTLQQLRLGQYQGTDDTAYKVHALTDAELAPITAACSLTSIERLGASAAMVGAAQGYKLPDGGWGSRVGTGRSVWASYLTPGLHIGSYFSSDTQAQAILHAKLTRGALVANPAQTDQLVSRDSNQVSFRLRAASATNS